jgi:murein DD-endopeptidase / murein LD-carboxypeptidase
MPCDPIIIKARALIGTPFRLHGRDPETGLDCVGFVACVFDRIADAPTGYAMRNARQDHWCTLLDRLCARRPDDAYDAGDILLISSGPAQFHLGLWTGNSLIHAHAGLRRVVETPGPIAAPIIGVWRHLQRNI